MTYDTAFYLLLACGAACAPADSQTPGRPNILIIHTDEHNFRTLGCYREELAPSQAFPWGEKVAVETPHIDRLAAQGVLFSHCYATSPVSSPSRASFLTGLYAPKNGVFTNDMVLSPQAATFAEILRQAGYATGYIGKLHLNGKGRPQWQPERDFGFTDNRYMYNRGHWKKIEERNGRPAFLLESPASAADSLTYPTDYFTDRALEFIRAHRDSAFCCILALPDPHSANLVRAPYDTMYHQLPFQTPLSAKADTTGMPAWCHGNDYPEDKPEDMAQYFGMIKCIDDAIGRLLKALEKEGIAQNTLVIFTADHGDMCGQHGLINKSVPMDDAARIPLIVSYPAALPQGIRVEPVVSVVDFAPSLLAVCGIATEQAFDGRELSALWKGQKLPARYADITFMRAPTTTMVKSDWDESRLANRSLWIAAVTPRYKLIFSENPGDKPWLTDLLLDPDEIQNRYDEPAYRPVARRLAEALQAYGREQKDVRVSHPKIAAEITYLLTSK